MNKSQQMKTANSIAAKIKDLLDLDSCYVSFPRKDKKRVRFHLASGIDRVSAPIAKHVVFNTEYDLEINVIHAIVGVWIEELRSKQDEIAFGLAGAQMKREQRPLGGISA
jgi:hypothetical protein